MRSYDFPVVNCENKTLKSLPVKIRDDVQTLILAENSITNLQIKDLAKFQSLKILDLRGTEFHIFKIRYNNQLNDAVHRKQYDNYEIG